MGWLGLCMVIVTTGQKDEIMRTYGESPDPESNPDYLGAGKPASEEDPRVQPESDDSE